MKTGGVSYYLFDFILLFFFCFLGGDVASENAGTYRTGPWPRFWRRPLCGGPFWAGLFSSSFLLFFFFLSLYIALLGR